MLWWAFVQCDDMLLVEQKLQENGVKYVRRVVVEDDVEVDQLFFHDPDGHMIEVCNCENLPVEPIIIPTPHLIKTATMKKQRVVVAPSLSSLMSTDTHFSQKLDNYKSSFAHWWVSLKYLWIWLELRKLANNKCQPRLSQRWWEQWVGLE